MSTTVPAMRAKFGSIDYYIVTMRAAELASKLHMPSELPGWEEMEIEERFQREVDYKRVRDHVAPYLAMDPDRFFGAMIVDIYNPEGVRFEPIKDVVTKALPGLYNSAANSFGFLHLEGGEILVPLDGQHRLAAMRFAIEGKDQNRQPIPNFSPNLDVGRDEVTVILVLHDPKKARKIFNKVNRYAKSTSKAEDLITADDDIVAVLVRKVVVNELIGERLVNYKSNTLSAKSPEFSTLSTLYDATLEFLQEVHGGKIDTTVLPPPAQQAVLQASTRDLWRETLISKFTLFEAALADRGEPGDSKTARSQTIFPAWQTYHTTGNRVSTGAVNIDYGRAGV